MPLVLLALIAAAQAQAAPDTVVVCPPMFQQSLQPWVEHRESQGHQLTFLGNDRSAEEIREAIRRLARGGRLRSVVLIGDAAPQEGEPTPSPAWHTPTHQVPAQVIVRWGSEPEIASDNPYGDLTGDGVPELAVGRLPVRTAEQLDQVVQKILDYERSTDHGLWRRRINLVAGTGGFSPLVDSVLEMATRRFLTDSIPDAFHISMTQARWQSPFCPDPRRFRDVVLSRLNEGCLFWVYIGHGHQQRLDAIRIPGAAYPILYESDVPRIAARQGLPIVLMLACYTGAYDQPQDCLAESMLRQPQGPVAVIAGSRVTMPYGMAVMSSGLMDQIFDLSPAEAGPTKQRASTLGEVVQRAKTQMVQPDADHPQRQWLDALAAAFSPAPEEMAGELREHLALFNLLGDPLLRLGRADQMSLAIPDSLLAGQTLRVGGNGGVAGKGLVEVVARRDRLKHDPPDRRHFDPADVFLRSFDPVYEQANDRVWIQQAFAACGEPFELELALPVETRGPCYVRVWIEGQDGAAQGAARLFVHPAATPTGAD